MTMRAVNQSSPLLKRRKIDSNEKSCVICNESCNEKQKKTDAEHWENFRNLALEWSSLIGKYSNVYSRVDWSSGPIGQLWHKDCKWKMANKKTLEQARATSKRSNSSSSIFIDDLSCEIPNIAEGIPVTNAPATRLNTGIIHDKDLCIFCNRGYDDKHPDRNKFRTMEQRETWSKIKASILFIDDLQIRNRLRMFVDSTIDPLAEEVRYHVKCFNQYVKPLYESPASDELQHINVKDMQQLFLQHVNERIIEEGEARTLQSLASDYERIRLNFGVVSEVKSSHVKELLTKEFGNRIGFHQRFQKNRSTIVFSCKGTGNYIESAINFWGVSTDDILKAAAKRIIEEIEEKPKLSWPPKVSELLNLNDTANSEPDAIQKFLKYLAGTRKDKFRSQITFLSDGIRSLVTGRPTKLPTILSVVIHGLTRSKEIVQMLSNVGIGVRYDYVFTLYDVWTYNDLIEHPICPEELAEEVPGTVDIDNDDFEDDDLTGGTTSHRTNMMFIQPEKYLNPQNTSKKPLKRTNKGDLKEMVLKEHSIVAYKKKSRGEPQLKRVDTFPATTEHIRKKMLIHAIVRCNEDSSDKKPDEQQMGALFGFMSSISEPENRSKAYYHATLPKSPSKKVVHTCMEKAVAAAVLKKMPFIQFVGDQPVFAFVEEIKSEEPEKFKLILPVLGSFHTQCAFMSSILSRFKGSGVEDILVSAGLIAEGSVEQALKGKHYNRAQRLYKLLYEALVRHLIRSGKNEGTTLPVSITDFIKILSNVQIESADRLFCLETLIQDEEFDKYVTKLFGNIQGPENHLANFIVSLMEMIEILFMNIDSIRTHNWKLYLESLRLMMPWLIIYDRVNYGRWLPVYWLRMMNLSEEETKWMPDIFAQSLTENPYSAQPMDMWIEVTMNKGSKLKAGWKRLLKNEKGLLTHVRNTNNVNALRSTLKNFLSELTSSYKHKENVKSRIRADESAVQAITSLFIEWQCDPYDTTNQDLRTLHGGMLCTDKLLKDFESAHQDGEDLLSLIFEERFFSKSKSLFQTMNRNGRLNFAKVSDWSPSTTKEGKVMESKGMIAVIELARSENPDLFNDIWKYRITDHCLSVFNHNGTMRKSQKSKLIEMLKFTEVNISSYTAIIDMGFLWHVTTPTADDRDKDDFSSFTWHDYAMKVYDVIRQRHRNAKSIILVNDYYGSDVVNIKDGEHATRAQKFMGGESQNIFPVASNQFPSINQFKDFFRNKGNKQRLQQFLKKEIAERAQKDHIVVLYSLRGMVEEISKFPNVLRQEYYCSHVEADSSIFYICSKMRNLGDNSPVVIDAEDMDVVPLSAYAANLISGDLAIKRKKGIFDCSQLCDPAMAEVIVRLHVITGCDTVSSFYGVGKKTVWKNVAGSKEAQSLLCEFTDEAMIKFIIRYIYNDKKSLTLADMRKARWSRMKRKSLVRVGLDRDTCLLRNKRVRYQTDILENFSQRESNAGPTLNGGWTTDGVFCTPIRYTLPPLPCHLNLDSPDEAEPRDDNEGENDNEDNEDDNEDAC